MKSKKKKSEDDLVAYLEKLIYYNETNLDILDEVYELCDADIDTYDKDMELVKILNPKAELVFTRLGLYECLDNIINYREHIKKKITAFKRLKKQVTKNKIEKIKALESYKKTIISN